MSNLLETHQKQVQQLKREFNATRDAINANSQLTQGGKSQQIRDAWAETNEKINEIQQNYKRAKAARIEEIKKELFGLDHFGTASESDKQAKITAYRNARETAMQTKTKEDLERLLSDADLFNDDTLKQGVGYAAYRKREIDILEKAFAEGLHDLVSELLLLEDTSPKRKTAEEMALAKVTGQ